MTEQAGVSAAGLRTLAAVSEAGVAIKPSALTDAADLIDDLMRVAEAGLGLLRAMPPSAMEDAREAWGTTNTVHIKSTYTELQRLIGKSLALVEGE